MTTVCKTCGSVTTQFDSDDSWSQWRLDNMVMAVFDNETMPSSTIDDFKEYRAAGGFVKYDKESKVYLEVYPWNQTHRVFLALEKLAKQIVDHKPNVRANLFNLLPVWWYNHVFKTATEIEAYKFMGSWDQVTANRVYNDYINEREFRLALSYCKLINREITRAINKLHKVYKYVDYVKELKQAMKMLTKVINNLSMLICELFDSGRDPLKLDTKKLVSISSEIETTMLIMKAVYGLSGDQYNCDYEGDCSGN